jgi:hypothetical protein
MSVGTVRPAIIPVYQRLASRFKAEKGTDLFKEINLSPFSLFSHFFWPGRLWTYRIARTSSANSNS